MAMTRKDIEAILDEMQFKYRPHDEWAVVFLMRMERYENPENGEKSLAVVVRLTEDGEYFSMFAPTAYRVKGPNQDAFLRACAQIQWKTKLIQFEWDESDGEVRPIIEFPLEDGRITRKQFERCLQGLCQILDEFHPALKKAAEEGVVDLPSAVPRAEVATLLEAAASLATGGAVSEAQARALQELLDRLRGGGGGGGSGSPGAPREL